MKYDNILNNFEFEGARAKVTVTVGIFRKNIVIALAPSFMDRFCCNFIQMLSMKNILTEFKVTVFFNIPLTCTFLANEYPSIQQ